MADSKEVAIALRRKILGKEAGSSPLNIVEDLLRKKAPIVRGDSDFSGMFHQPFEGSFSSLEKTTDLSKG